MLLRDFALRVLTETDLERKLAPLEAKVEVRDDERAGVELPDGPGRPEDLRIVPIRKAQTPKLSLNAWRDPHQRRRLLHALANHELQAAELFAWTLLRFPETPAEFRRGMTAILQDEQRHTRMYIGRLEASGGRFGEFPVSGHFWNKVDGITTPSAFLCAMSLTFENANLDHSLEIAAIAREAGDEKSALLVESVHRDEIEHVRFGWHWLRRFKAEDESMWDAYTGNLGKGLHPGRASGRTFRREGRRAAGLDEAFIDQLERAQAKTDAGGRRTD